MLFPDGALHIELYEDLAADPAGVARRVFSFLGVDDTFRPDVGARLNQGGVPREGLGWSIASTYDHPVRRVLRPLLPHRLRLRLLTRLRAKSLSRPTIDPQVRADLVAGYREDILRLQERLNRDLSTWLR
jgi:hypothetical protein